MRGDKNSVVSDASCFSLAGISNHSETFRVAMAGQLMERSRFRSFIEFRARDVFAECEAPIGLNLFYVLTRAHSRLVTPNDARVRCLVKLSTWELKDSEIS